MNPCFHLSLNCLSHQSQISLRQKKHATFSQVSFFGILSSSSDEFSSPECPMVVIQLETQVLCYSSTNIHNLMQKPVGFFPIFDNWPVGFFVKSSRLLPTAYAYFDHCRGVQNCTPPQNRMCSDPPPQIGLIVSEVGIISTHQKRKKSHTTKVWVYLLWLTWTWGSKFWFWPSFKAVWFDRNLYSWVVNRRGWVFNPA